jgi:hypothetical protein
MDGYRISTFDSLNMNTITDMGWYTKVVVSGGTEYADDFKQDLEALGYAASGWNTNDDISAYTRDNATISNYTMYAWKKVASVRLLYQIHF